MHETKEQKQIQAQIDMVRTMVEPLGFRQMHDFCFINYEFDIEADLQNAHSGTAVMRELLKAAIQEGERRKAKQIRDALNIK